MTGLVFIGLLALLDAGLIVYIACRIFKGT